MVPNDNEEKFTKQEIPEDPWDSEPPPSRPIEKGDQQEDSENQQLTKENN